MLAELDEQRGHIFNISALKHFVEELRNLCYLHVIASVTVPTFYSITQAAYSTCSTFKGCVICSNIVHNL
jgi:hypothetical protein